MARWRIIRQMKYVIKSRQLVRVVFDETNNPTDPNPQTSKLPTTAHCKRKFQEIYSYDDTVTRMTFAIATYDKFLDYKLHNGSQRVRITGEGLKLITSYTYFLNALAGVVGSIVPIVVSVIALIVSIVAIVIKLS